MHLHFSTEEFSDRPRRTRETLLEQGLDGILLFRQESMYYLTGYDTDGFVLFQTLFLGVDGQLTLVTRSADRVQAAYTSTIEDVRIWVDSGQQNPALDVRSMLDSHQLRGKRIGVEYDAYGLSAHRGKLLEAALEAVAPLVQHGCKLLHLACVLLDVEAHLHHIGVGHQGAASVIVFVIAVVMADVRADVGDGVRTISCRSDNGWRDTC